MKAQISIAVVFRGDDGKVTNIAFSEESALVMLAIDKQYAQSDPPDPDRERKRQEVSEAEAVVLSANLPKYTTSVDGHYCAVAGIAGALESTEAELLKRDDQAVPKEGYPGVALCFFIRGGRHNLCLAFSREAAKTMVEGISLTYEETQAALAAINSNRFPFPQDPVQLDDEFAKMLSSRLAGYR